MIDVLWSMPDGLPSGEILSRIRAAIPLSDDEKAYIPSTKIRLYERDVRLAVEVLVQAGWFIKQRERWYLSDDGKAACKNFRNAEEFYKAALAVNEKKQRLRDDAAVVVEEAEEKAWAQVWRYLQEVSPVDFKFMVADLLQALGYHVDWIAPPGKSRGYIDMIAYSGPLAGRGPRIKVHVRHTGQQATTEGLRAFLDVLLAEDAGIFISSGGFTEVVREEARSNHPRKLRLISSTDFFDLWVENYDNLSQEGRRRLPVKPVYFVAPE